jgi:glycogen debranching enzyme
MFSPDLAEGALSALAALQGSSVDAFTDEEPGRILHEIRFGKLTALGEIPHTPYYGTIDATPLWLILLAEHRRISGDDGLARRLRQPALRALRWIDEYGDRDGDGHVEYATRSTKGLVNQGWKDSGTGIQFADGRIAEPPIALCEVQGYVYDAKTRIAAIAEEVWDDSDLAGRLRAEADDLFERFNRDFWIDERGGYMAVGLDGRKQRIDSMTSNMGHLLWSGIVDPERASVLVERLFSDELFSGWGVRTLSSNDAGFNPIAYHTGSVWPHDNALISAGLARYGFRQEANSVAVGLLQASGFLGDRLAEVFGGYARAESGYPVRCPTASSPQAWASAAPFQWLRVMLGLDVRNGALTVDPAVPREIGALALRGLPALGGWFDVEAEGDRGTVTSVPQPEPSLRSGRARGGA